MIENEITSKTLIVLLEDFIDVLMDEVENEEIRQAIYDNLIQPFEAAGAGFDEFSEALGFDPVFDTVISEHYPEMVDRDD